MKFFSPPPASRKVRTPSSRSMGTPGTQPRLGPTAAVASQVAKVKPPRSGAPRRGKPFGNPNTPNKEVVPRATIETRAKPKAEY